MPILGSLMAGLFQVLFTFFAKLFGINVAAKLVAVTIISGMIAALYVSAMSCATECQGAIDAAANVHPALAQGLGIAFNNVTYSVFGCYSLVWVACRLYAWKKTLYEIMVK